MSSFAPRLAAATTGLLSGLVITQAIAGHWFAAVGCALGAVFAGLWWRAARRADDARRWAAVLSSLPDTKPAESSSPTEEKG